MTRINHKQKNFNLRRLLFATVPSYIIPTIMSFTPGYLLHKPDLMKASYTSIAIPSLVSSLLTYMVLWRMEAAQKFPANKIVRTLLMVAAMVTLGVFVIVVFRLQLETFNILSSAVLGAVITTLTQPMTKNKNAYEQ